MLQEVYAAVSTTVNNPLGTRYNTLKNVFSVAMNVIMAVAVSLGVIFLGLGGIQYITSKGDAKAADAARASITNAVIGMVIALAALAVKTIVVKSILGSTATDPTITI